MKVLKKSDLSYSSGFDRMVLIYSDFNTTTILPRRTMNGISNSKINQKYKYWGNWRK